MDSGIESTESSNGSSAENTVADPFNCPPSRNGGIKDLHAIQNQIDVSCSRNSCASSEAATEPTSRSVQTQTTQTIFSPLLTNKLNFNAKEEASNSSSRCRLNLVNGLPSSSPDSSSILDQQNEDYRCDYCDDHSIEPEKDDTFVVPEGSLLKLHFPIGAPNQEHHGIRRIFNPNPPVTSSNNDLGTSKILYPEMNIPLPDSPGSSQDTLNGNHETLPGLSFENVTPKVFSYSSVALPYERRDLQRKFKHYHRKLQRVISITPKEKKLRIAASVNNVELVQRLLREGVNPKSKDEKGRTALHVCASKGFVEIVRLLLQSGADPNQKDAAGNTPLHLAACTSRLETINLLLNAGSNAKEEDNQGHSPLHLAKARLKLIQKNSCASSQELKIQVDQVVNMIKCYLESAGNADDAELLQKFSHQLSLSDTRHEVEQDLQSLLDSINDLNLSKSKP